MANSPATSGPGEPPRIVLDTERENPIVLTRQNLRTPKGSPGIWLVDVPQEQRLNVKLWFKAPGVKCTLTYKCGETCIELEVEADSTTASLGAVLHSAGKAEISGTINGKYTVSVDYVELAPAR